MLRQYSIPHISFASVAACSVFRRFRCPGTGMSAVFSMFSAPVSNLYISLPNVWPFRGSGAVIRFYSSHPDIDFFAVKPLNRFSGGRAALGCFREGGRPGNPVPPRFPFEHIRGRLIFPHRQTLFRYVPLFSKRPFFNTNFFIAGGCALSCKPTCGRPSAGSKARPLFRCPTVLYTTYGVLPEKPSAFLSSHGGLCPQSYRLRLQGWRQSGSSMPLRTVPFDDSHKECDVLRKCATRTKSSPVSLSSRTPFLHTFPRIAA